VQHIATDTTKSLDCLQACEEVWILGAK
jgi:hypothetical protein